MRRILSVATILTVCITFLTLNSCKKETPDTETQGAVDNAVCEGEFNSRIQVINSITIKEQGVKSNPTVTVGDTTMGFPRSMTIDYGTVGIQDSIDHKVRKGQMIVRFDNRWHITGTIAVVKLVDYFVANTLGGNWVQYAADSIIIIHGANSFTNNIVGGKCVSPTWNLEWSSDRTVTQTEGIATLDAIDDVFSTTGTTTGKDRNGKSYKVNITSPIIKRANCSWMEAGRLEITPDGMPARTIDYGSGACDSKASITIDGNTFTFNMN